MSETVLEIRNMSKSFGPIVALKDVNLTVRRGEVHGLIGENGSGKSTITSIAAGAGNVYPILVSAGKTDIKLYTGGFEGTDDVDNFGSRGNGCFQGLMFSTPEAVVYPLCLMIDKLNGYSYSDQPEGAERVDCSQMFIMDDEDMDKMVENGLYYDADFSKSLITGEEAKNLCASYNADATYAGLLDRINHLGIEDL